MNQHSTSGIRRNAKDVINKAKNLQRLGETQRGLSSALLHSLRRRALNRQKLLWADWWATSFVIVADPVQKDEINRKAFEKFKKEHNQVPATIDNAVPSERFEGESVLTEEGLAGLCLLAGQDFSKWSISPSW